MPALTPPTWRELPGLPCPSSLEDATWQWSSLLSRCFLISPWYILGEPGGICLVGGTDRAGTVSLTPDQEAETVDRILDVSVSRAPDLADAGLVNTIVGLRTMSPDDHALIGGVPDISGLYCACGFSGHGFMHAPAVGEGLADLITEGQSAKIDLSAFAPDRFADGDQPLVPETHVF